MDLWFVLNSHVMGLQFCDGSGTAGSNQFGVATKYVAALTLDLKSAKKTAVDDETSKKSAYADIRSSQNVRQNLARRICVFIRI